MKRKNKIAVIGAGLAGLTAAYRLYQQGYDVDIYEARSRVGGRVFSAFIAGTEGDSVVELGGQNIPDGGEALTLKELAKELGLSLCEDEIDLRPFFYNFETKDYTDIFKLQSDYFLLKNKESFKSKLQDLAEKSKNMEEVLLSLFPDKGILYRSFVIRFAGYEGGTPSQISSEAWEDLYYMFFGGVAAVHTTNKIQRSFIQGGNARIALEIAKKLKGRIHFSHPLKALNVTKENRILLVFNENRKKEYDKIVLTIPCSVYKDVAISSHLIPKNRLDFFKKVPYGSNAKVLFKGDFSSNSHNFIMTDEMSAFFTRDDSIGWLYFSGYAGRTFKSFMKERYDQALDALHPFLKTRDTFLPLFANDKAQFHVYANAVTHSWVDDPYSQGSYSYRSPEIMEEVNQMGMYCNEKVRVPYFPLMQRVFFAGEHTAIDASFGTLEGAVESGERAARMLMISDTYRS